MILFAHRESAHYILTHKCRGVLHNVNG